MTDIEARAKLKEVVAVLNGTTVAQAKNALRQAKGILDGLNLSDELPLAARQEKPVRNRMLSHENLSNRSEE